MLKVLVIRQQAIEIAVDVPNNDYDCLGQEHINEAVNLARKAHFEHWNKNGTSYTVVDERRKQWEEER